MNKSIMWFQPAKLNDSDIILVDGNEVQTTDFEERNSAFTELSNLFSVVLKKDRPWSGSHKFEGVKYHFVKGTLCERDEKGRVLSFDFVAKADCWKEELEKCIDTIGINMSKETQKSIAPFLKKVLWCNVRK